MNRIYRTLWSVATQSWQAVPETAKSAGKKSQSSSGGVLASVALGLSLVSSANAQAPPSVNQLPTGGSVARGTATIQQTATAQAAAMTVNQSSQRAVINWNTFNVGSNASVNFVQPNAQAVTLNRVNDSNPSQIFGRISANGQVFLTNANGVYFSPSSSVDVGALTATTHSITDDNFMSGNYVFERNGATGKVINEGNITAALGGYVALLAPEVQNAGVVVARAGTVAMAAGELITLNVDGAGSLAGITTTPSAIASLVENKLAVLAPDGQIILSAVALDKLQAGMVKNSGSLEANSLVNKGGKIVLEADQIAMDRNSKIVAKGPLGGGVVLVGGDWQGSGTLRQATKVTMEAGATIDASATDNGDGGKVVLWSDVHNADSVTQVNGSINANAGPNGGNGGKVETSGHQLKVGSLAQVDTQGGQWLLDPYNFTIAASGGDITGAQLGTALSSNNVTIQTFATGNATATGSVLIASSNAASGNGDISINDAVAWTSAKVLTLTAVGAINGTANITMNGSSAGQGLVFDQAADGTFSGNIVGNTTAKFATFTKLGAGTLTMSGTGVGPTLNANNTFFATTIAAGTLKMGHQSVFGNNLSSVSVSSGATLDVSNVSPSTAIPLTLNGSGVGGVGALMKGISSANSGWTGVITLGSDTLISSASGSAYGLSINQINGQGHNLTVTSSGITSGYFNSYVNLGTGSLTKIGNGNWYATVSNTSVGQGYSGGTYILGGTLTASSASAYTNPFGSGAILLNGGNLQLNSSTQSATSFSIGSNGGNVSSSSGVLKSPSFNIDSTSQVIISAVLADPASGTGTLTKSGTGTLIFTMTNTYTGTTNINAGTLQIGNGYTSGSIASASAISIASGATLAYNLASYTDYSAGPPVVNQTRPLNTISGTGTITNAYQLGAAGSNTILDLSGATLTGFSGTYSVYLNEGNGTTTPALASIKLGSSPDLSNATFNVVTAGYKSTFTSVQGVTWTGTANLGTPSSGPLLKANGTTMTSGVMGLGATLTFMPLSATNLTIGQGGAWSLTGNVNGTTGTVYLPQTNSATYTLNGTVTADVLNGVTITQSGALTQQSIAGGATNGNLVVNGNGGTLILSANNTYAGTTTINSGTLQIGSAGTTGTLGGGAVVDNATLFISRSDAISLSTVASYAGAITGTGNIKIQSRGNLTINRDITLSGAASRIDLLAGSNYTTGYTADGDLTLNNTITTSDTGTINIFTASPSTSTGTSTSNLMLKMVGATGALKYKNYSTTVNTMPSVVLGTRNFNYRQAETLSYSGATFNKTYDGTTTATLTGGSVSGAIDGDSFTASATASGTYSSANAGTTISVTTTPTIAATSGTGWSLSGVTTSSTTYTGTIAARPINLTANAATKIYGEANPAFTYTAEASSAGRGLVTGDVFTGALSSTATTTSGVNNNYVISLGTLANSNYAISYTSANLTITARPINLTANAATKIYGETNPAFSYATEASSAGRGLVTGDVFAGGLTTTATTTSGVNTYAITSTLANSNYAISYTPANLTITARPINLTANAATRIYGDANPAFTYTAEASSTGRGLVTGDVFAGALSSAATTTSGVNNNYVISLGTLANSNYAISYTSANLTITARPITVTANSLNKVYGNADPTLTYTLTSGSMANSETLSGALSRASGETVGTYAIGQGTLAASSNYTLTYAAANLVIDPRPVALTGQMNYSGQPTLDTTQTGTTLSATNVVQGDSLTVSGTATLASAAAGTRAITAFNSLTLNNSNYTTTGASGSVTVISTNNINVAPLNNNEVAALIGSQLAGLTGSQIASFSTTQLQVFSWQQIGSLSAAQFASLTPAQLASLSTAQLFGLSASQLSLMTTAQLSGLSSSQLASLSNAQLQGLTATQVSAMTAAQLSLLTPAQIALLTGNAATPLNLQQILALTPAQITGLSTIELARLTAADVSALSAAQLSALTPSQLAALSPSSFAMLSAAQIAALSMAQLSGLTPNQLASLSNAQLQALTAAQVNAISATQLSLLTPAQIALLTGNAGTPLNLQQILALTPAQITGLSTIEMARLTAADISALSNAQLSALSLEQLAALSPSSLGMLSAAQIAAFSTAQVASLTPDQLRGLTPTQIASLSAAELASFDELQLAAIGIFPKADTPEAEPVATAKYEAPIPVMTEVAAPSAPAVEVPAATPATAAAAPQPAAPSVSSMQTAQAATASAIRSEASTGVLPVTVLSSANARPNTTGVAFEQDTNGVSLHITAAPSVPPVSAKLVFNDKLTSFMVAQANGQMVEFQGGLINKRLVIIAPSSAAKQIARTEMNMVLAAAITSLGADNRVVLANLDGVVIDLR